MALVMLSQDPSSPRGGTPGRQLASYWQPPTLYRYNHCKYSGHLKPSIDTTSVNTVDTASVNTRN